MGWGVPGGSVGPTDINEMEESLDHRWGRRISGMGILRGIRGPTSINGVGSPRGIDGANGHQ